MRTFKLNIIPGILQREVLALLLTGSLFHEDESTLASVALPKSHSSRQAPTGAPYQDTALLPIRHGINHGAGPLQMAAFLSLHQGWI